MKFQLNSYKLHKNTNITECCPQQIRCHSLMFSMKYIYILIIYESLPGSNLVDLPQVD